MNPNGASEESPRHSIGRSILLHLAPGALIFIVYAVGAAILKNSLPPVALLAALSLGIVLALVPCRSKRSSGRPLKSCTSGDIYCRIFRTPRPGLP